MAENGNGNNGKYRRETDKSITEIAGKLQTIVQLLEVYNKNREDQHKELKEQMKDDNERNREDFKTLVDRITQNEKAIIEKVPPCLDVEGKKCKPIKNIEGNAVTRSKAAALWGLAITSFVLVMKLIIFGA